MPSQKRKDDDLVLKDVPERPTKRTKDSEQHPDIPKPNDLPPWDPLIISNDLERGTPRLPFSIRV